MINFFVRDEFTIGAGLELARKRQIFARSGQDWPSEATYKESAKGARRLAGPALKSVTKGSEATVTKALRHLLHGDFTAK